MRNTKNTENRAMVRPINIRTEQGNIVRFYGYEDTFAALVVVLELRPALNQSIK